MTYTPRMPDEGDGSPYMETDEFGTYQTVNEEAVYLDPDWEYPDAYLFLDNPYETAQAAQDSQQVEDDTLTPSSSTAAAGSRGFVNIGRGNGRATVRTTKPATFSGSIPFNGQVSGSFPAGAVFTGPDRNGDGVPDILERLLRDRRIRF